MPHYSRRTACKALGVVPPGDMVFAVHPSWSSWLALDRATARLLNMDHNSKANFTFSGDLLLITWDNYSTEHFKLIDGMYVFETIVSEFERNDAQRFQAERLNLEPWAAKTRYDWAKQQLLQSRLELHLNAQFEPNVFVAEDVKIFCDYLRMGQGSWVASNALLRNALTIGAKSGINYGAVIAGRVSIGENTQIAAGAAIYGFNHNYRALDRPMMQQDVTIKGVIIGDDVWIGANAVILDGVTIGSHSVIAAGAVVTRDVPAYHLAAGVPARLVHDKRALPGAEASAP